MHFRIDKSLLDPKLCNVTCHIILGQGSETCSETGKGKVPVTCHGGTADLEKRGGWKKHRFGSKKRT